MAISVESRMDDISIMYKVLEPFKYASLRKVINKRDEMPAIIEEVRAACGEVICGDPLAIFHGGAVKEGFLVEVGFPVKRSVETGEVHTRTLESTPVLSSLHTGTHQTNRDTLLKMLAYLDQRAWSITGTRYEIYRRLDAANPGNNLTENLVILHKWDRLIAESSQKVLGAEAGRKLMQGTENITLDTPIAEYTTWICDAMQRLDALTDDDQKKCRIVSACAHVFPQARIDHLREIYEHGEFDDVLREMYTDFFWYGDPERVGNVLHIKKRPPFDEEGYKKAKTPAERRKANCHCKYVHPFLDEVPGKLSPTFCYCGVGWYIRLWEGVLGKPVKVGNLRSLLNGDDECSLTITLPLELTGECMPPMKRKFSNNTL